MKLFAVSLLIGITVAILISFLILGLIETGQGLAKEKVYIEESGGNFSPQMETVIMVVLGIIAVLCMLCIVGVILG